MDRRKLLYLYTSSVLCTYAINESRHLKCRVMQKLKEYPRWTVFGRKGHVQSFPSVSFEFGIKYGVHILGFFGERSRNLRGGEGVPGPIEDEVFGLASLVLVPPESRGKKKKKTSKGLDPKVRSTFNGL